MSGPEGESPEVSYEGSQPRQVVDTVELQVTVTDETWDPTTFERVTGINISDTGILVIQANVVIGNQEVNTAIASYAPGFWSRYVIQGAETSEE
jgi:hypothetical protein